MGQIPKGKLMTEQLDKDGWREFKSVSGSLQWLAGQSRSDAAAVTSLANKGRETTYNDLFTLYEAIAAVKATENLGILIGPIPLNKATLIIGYGDSSWANAPGGKSQMGVLLLLASPDATERIKEHF